MEWAPFLPWVGECPGWAFIRTPMKSKHWQRVTGGHRFNKKTKKSCVFYRARKSALCRCFDDCLISVHPIFFWHAQRTFTEQVKIRKHDAETLTFTRPSGLKVKVERGLDEVHGFQHCLEWAHHHHICLFEVVKRNRQHTVQKNRRRHIHGHTHNTRRLKYIYTHSRTVFSSSYYGWCRLEMREKRRQCSSLRHIAES